MPILSDLAPDRDVTTLFELVRAVAEVADGDCEVVAVLVHLIESGRVRFLRGASGL